MSNKDVPSLDEALKPNASGNYDGVAVLSALSGQPRAEVLKMWERIKEQSARTKACSLHEFDPIEGAKMSPTHRCKHCGWEPRAGEQAFYEQGLAHGRRCAGEPLSSSLRVAHGVTLGDLEREALASVRGMCPPDVDARIAPTAKESSVPVGTIRIQLTVGGRPW